MDTDTRETPPGHTYSNATKKKQHNNNEKVREREAFNGRGRHFSVRRNAYGERRWSIGEIHLAERKEK